MGDVIHRYIDGILKGCTKTEFAEVFDPSYSDHDPIRIPGVIDAAVGGNGLGYVSQVVAFLRSPSVDIDFELLDAFTSLHGDKIACRIRGEGTIVLRSLSPSENEESTTESRGSGAASGSGVVEIPGSALKQPGKLLGRRLHVDYYSTSIFATHEGRLSERWGLDLLR
jgi:hypothetical protein